MKNLGSLLNYIKANGLTLIVTLAMMLFTQQVHISQQLLIPIEKDVATETSDSDETPMTLLDVDHSVVTAGVQFHVDHVFYEIMNIEQDEEQDHFHNKEDASIPDEFHKILFSQVISPNAP